MARIAPVESATASSDVAKVLDDLFGDWGERWRVVETIANSPALLDMFVHVHTRLKTCSLSDDDREVIDLWMAESNGCHYCIPAHILASRHTGLPDSEIAAILDGIEPADARRQLILKATKAIQETKGGLADDVLEKFQDEGLSRENLFDIIGEIAHCTITNYSNRLAQTDLDNFLEDVRL
ncbi:MAG: carboxymuconolactone decarboxylase family protein [Rhodospirillales bacterium]|jgi:AhpD family alkylhydroperoxidase|nr:carboxymuconolactone decarboxylase family protein [Rhodospirillales bacterium]MBT4040965.1 carboxymuconolactone decarboxylase family protein [Rhodospirillales bacterium]MBT4625633.1 carboxymuconolactone decarboxylase family protein [Rhodospirillales bacterium]MBT5350198.1 carboxymuconolactone decarboxylase family protein [Rhodospirillales bacterium]MBT5522020.1 carboxymuconolactone decarboxylase family protein [Rhodospirillales bacterium]